ncbi:MAG: hypothetical protein DLM62_14910 [Pseudonocardiales bacterium]|nr:MAG: hypothetical protein DLM62_14910 [Pseudonocardiales bacterium]
MTKVLGRSPDRRKRQVIELRLMQARDMFEMPSTDLFSEYRNLLTGVDFCLSELRGRAFTRPVRLEIRLPPEMIDDGVAERLARTLRRYCDHRIRYNRREGQAQRVGGVAALRIGIPVSALGLVVAAEATRIRPTGSAGNLVTDHLGWVLAWIGLWFPLDQFLFNPLAYRRESRVLRLLAGADIDVRPYRLGTDTEAR